MLKLFGGGADHPMRNPKEARRILEALPAEDLKALEELAHWLESVSVAEGFKTPERAALVCALDEAAQPRLRKVAREYCGTARPSRYQENRMWTQLHEYWKQAGLAFGRTLEGAAQAPKALDAKSVALAATRALRAAAQQVKWQHMRYGPVDPAAWGILNKVYAYCEARGLADAKLALYPAGGGETSPKQEFLKALMFSASSPDSLLAPEVELVERVIAELAPSFLLANAPAAGLLYWIDLGRAMAPQRIVRPPEASAGLRCFGPGNALASLQAIIQRAEGTRELPQSLGPAADPEAALDVLRHLAVLWSPEPPERKHARHMVKSRLTIAHGFAGVLEAVGEAGASLDFDQKAAESWVVENVSAGGFGAIVPQAKGDWLRVGALLAMQPDGGNNWLVGAIRRVNRTSAQEARVGIESLSRAPKVVKFRVRGLGEETGLLLPSAVLGSGEVSIAMRAGVYPPGQNLEASFDGREHVYLPQGGSERAEDYELIRFREMIRES
ncbi:MAG: hypothetical protein E6H57_07585 [Betaproteobacteria bacterium]|nr:MAG: hypothetical protein E6H57_07585 [Betaproteobacteria bacterium]